MYTKDFNVHSDYIFCITFIAMSISFYNARTRMKTECLVFGVTLMLYDW